MIATRRLRWNPHLSREPSVDAWRLVNLTGLITTDGLTAHGHRVVDGTADVEDALAVGVRECMIGQDGIEIVPLLQRGATILAKTKPCLGTVLPGLTADRDGSHRLLGLCRVEKMLGTPGRSDCYARCGDAPDRGSRRIAR